MKKVCGKELNDEKRKYSKLMDVMDVLVDNEKENFIISIEDKTAECRLCKMFVALTFIDLSKHIQTYHKDEFFRNLDLLDHGKLRAQLAKYGRNNFIKLNEIGSKGYCSLCDAHLSAHIKVAAQHVSGARHMGHLELRGLVERKVHSVPGLRVMSLQQFLKYMFHNKPLHAFWINYSLSVNMLSFMFTLHMKEEKQKCYCCDMLVNWAELKQHWQTKKHKDSFMASDVLLMDDEFIRVIKPDLFHCGLCNQVFPFWETMNKHINSFEHRLEKTKSKLACKLALQGYADNKTIEIIKLSGNLYAHLLDHLNLEP